MRIIPFYIIHTVKNSIRRTLRSKAGIAMVLFFLILTVFLFVITFMGSGSQTDQVVTESMNELLKIERSHQICGLVVSGIFIIFFFFEFFTGNKKGSQIFQMSDVNLLFAAPIRPQSILIFRIILQMGASLLASVYMIYQMPNLMFNLGISFVGALGILLCYFLMLVLGNLCSIYIYCLCANRPRLKESICPCLYILCLVLLVAYGVQVLFYHQSALDAGIQLLNGKWFTQIPIIGWLKGLTMAFITGNLKSIILYGVLIIITMFVLVLLIYRTRVDYYEDAMENATKMYENLIAAKEGRNVERKRSDKIKRTEGIVHGFGANVFYYKSVDSHKRFAKFGIFSGTNQLYYVVCLAVALAQRFLFETSDLLMLVLILGFISLFLAAGTTLATEISLNYIYLVPESAEKKIVYCSLADIRNFIIDTLLPYLIAMVILRADVVLAIGCYLLLVSLYFISDQMGAWLDLVFPSNVSMVMRVIMLYMKVLAAIPATIVFVIALACGNITVGVYLAALVSIPSGLIFMCLCPGVLRKGKK